MALPEGVALDDHRIPGRISLQDHVVEAMQEASQLYGKSPFRLNTAQVLDALTAALLAAKKSMPSMQDGVFQQKSLFEALTNVSFDGASSHISFASKMARNGSTSGDLASAMLTLRQVHSGQLLMAGTVVRTSGFEAVRTWHVHLQEGFIVLPGTIKLPSGQHTRSFDTVQYDASGRNQQEQKVPTQTDWSSNIIKGIVGLVVVGVVISTLPPHNGAGGWARTVISARYPGGETQQLRTATRDDEAVDEAGE